MKGMDGNAVAINRLRPLLLYVVNMAKDSPFQNGSAVLLWKTWFYHVFASQEEFAYR